MSSYQGRHRAPKTPRGAQRAATLALALAVPSGLLALQGSASADTLADIRGCESSGDYRATNGSHFGAYQFDLKTWRSVGGTGNPMNASPAEQDQRAEMLLAARGTQPWDASATCRARHKGSPTTSWHKAAKPAAKKAAKKAAPEHKSWKHAAAAPKTDPQLVVVVSGDTLSQIAARLGEDWHVLYAHNRETVGANPNLILPGQRLAA